MYTGRALIGAAALVTEAYSNVSPAGAFFLALFLVWGVSTRPAAGPRAAARAGLVLWSLSFACSAALLLLLLLLPLLVSAGMSGFADSDSPLWHALGLRDWSQCSSLPQLILGLLPPLLCTFTSLAEAQDAYAACGRAASSGTGAGTGSSGTVSSGTGAGTSTLEGAEAVALAPGAAHEPSQPPASSPGIAGGGGSAHAGESAAAARWEEGGRAAGTGGATRDEGGSAAALPTAAAAVAGLLVGLTALLWPALFNLPWLLLVSLAVLMWALRASVRAAAQAPLLRLAQGYAALCLTALYAYQLQPPSDWPPAAARGARALGLYRLEDLAAAPSYDRVPVLLHLAALTALYGALGFAAQAAAEGCARRSMRHITSHGGPHRAADRLGSPRQQQAPQQGHFGAGAVLRGASPDRGPVQHRHAAAPHEGDRRLQGHHHSPHHHHGHSHGRGQGQSHRGGGWLSLLVSRVAGRALGAAAGLSRHPGVAALALACLSMAQVSLLGGALLLVGMWTLLAPGRYGRRLLRRCSPALTVLLLAWNAAVYVITCLAASYPHLLPPVLHSVGLFMYQSPPPVVLPLAGQLLAILAMAGLCRSRSRTPSSSSASQAAQAARSGPAHPGPSALTASSSIVYAPTLLSLTLLLYHSLHVLVPLSWVLVGSYRLDLLHGAYLLWLVLYCGGAGLRLSPDPRVGPVLPDIADSAPSAAPSSGSGAAGAVVAGTGQVLLLPPLPAAPPAHRRLRLYGSVHLLALYAAMCGRLPGLGFLQREDWRGALQLVGLWDISCLRDCLPLLGALVLATAHAVAGKALRAAAAALQAQEAAQEAGASAGGGSGSAGALAAVAAASPRGGGAPAGAALRAPAAASVAVLPEQGRGAWPAASMGASGAAAVPRPAPPPPQLQGWLLALGQLVGTVGASGGAFLLAALVYVVVLYDARVCAVGLGYLALGLLLLLWPPLRVQYVARLRLSHHGPSGHSLEHPQPHLYLSSSVPGGIICASARWLGPAALTLYGAADMCLVYVAATLAAYGSKEEPASLQWPWAQAVTLQPPEWWQRLIALLYCEPAVAPGPRLVLALARPACLLLVLQLYRWTFASAAVLKWLQRGQQQCHDVHGWQEQQQQLQHPTSTAHAAAAAMAAPRRLRKQESALWFCRRWLMLNLDLIATLLLFALLMSSPGALAVFILATGIVSFLFAVWRAAAARCRRGAGARRTRDSWRGLSASSDDEGAEGRVGGGFAADLGADAGGDMHEGAGPGVGDSVVAAGFFAAVQLVLVAWVLLLYALQLGAVARWVRRVSEDGEEGLAPWSPAAVLEWLGLPLCVPAAAEAAAAFAAALFGLDAEHGGVAGRVAARRLQQDPAAAEPTCSPAEGLRKILLLQLFTLAALALRSKARRWRNKLPRQLVAAAAPGQPCCLFWPPPSARPDAAVLPWLGPRAPLQRVVRRAVSPVTVRVKQGMAWLGRGAYGVLKAMDVPAEELVPQEGEGEPEQALPAPPPLQRRTSNAASSPSSRQQAAQPVAAAAQQATPVGSASAAGRVQPPAGAAAQPQDYGEAGLGPSGEEQGASTGVLAYRRSAGGVRGGGAKEGGCEEGPPAGWLLFVRLVVRGCMEAWEAAWVSWCGEVVLLALLLAAFTASSALTLLLLSAIGAGMAASPPVQAALRRRAVLPILGAMLLYEYCAWVGLPNLLFPALGHQPPYPTPAELLGLPPVLAAWLGAQDVGPLLPWTLFLAMVACLMQVNAEMGPPPQAPAQADAEDRQGSAPALGGGRWRPGSWRRRSTPGATSHPPDNDNDLEAPLLTSVGPIAAHWEVRQQSAPREPSAGTYVGGAVPEGGSPSGRSSGVSGGARLPPQRSLSAAAATGATSLSGPRTCLFSPVEPWAQARWTVLDWARYHLVRHVADLLLVALVGLVALQRDLLRAGYLAHCLLLFRRRPELTRPGGAGGALFGRLVAFNFFVLLLEGAFQAPWELLLGRSWAVPCSLRAIDAGGGDDPSSVPSCTFPRLMGLCQLQPGRGGSDDHSSAAGWGPWQALLDSPVLADLVVWLLLRLHVRTLHSRLFAAVSRLADLSQAQHVAALRRQQRDSLEAAARGALAASHARSARERRIFKLKVLLLGPGDGVTSADTRSSGGVDNAAYMRSLRSGGEVGGMQTASRFGGGGSQGSGALGLLRAPGGGPKVAGLAELLDADVDLADVAAAAAAEDAAERRSGTHGRVSWAAAREAGGRGGDGGRRRPSMEVPSDLEDWERGGGVTAAVHSAGLAASRRSRSYADLESAAHQETALPSSPSDSALRHHQRVSLERQLSGGRAAASHRRHASVDTIPPFRGVAGAADSGESSASARALPGATGTRRLSSSGSLVWAPESDAARRGPAGTPAAVAAEEIEPSTGEPAGASTWAAPGRGDRRPRRRLSWPPLLVRLYGTLVAPLLVARRHDDDSYTCYIAFLVLFLLDMSALAAVLPLSMFLYALLLRRKPRPYWQGALLYVETVLILQYSYLVLGKCLCATRAAGGGGAGSSCIWIFGQHDFLLHVQALGLHSDALRALPLFLCYLATLMHSYNVDLVYAAVAQPAPGAPAAAPASASVRGPRGGAAGSSAGAGSSSGLGRAAMGSLSWLSWRYMILQVRQAAATCRRLVLHLRDVYRFVTSDHEVAPHWLKLQLQLPRPRSASDTLAEAGPAGSSYTARTASGDLPAVSGVPAMAPAVLPAPAAEGAGGVAAGSVQLQSLQTARSDPVAAAERGASRVAVRPGPATLTGPALAAALQQLLEAVHSHGEAVRRWREEDERWRRVNTAGQADNAAASSDSSDDEGVPRTRGRAAAAEGGAAEAPRASSRAFVDRSDPCAAAELLSRHRLPRLRLEHEAVSSAGAVTHVLLQVEVGRQDSALLSEADASAELASPTPAHDAATMLRCAVQALHRQRAVTLAVPPFRRPAGAFSTLGDRTTAAASSSDRGGTRTGGGSSVPTAATLLPPPARGHSHPPSADTPPAHPPPHTAGAGEAAPAHDGAARGLRQRRPQDPASSAFAAGAGTDRGTAWSAGDTPEPAARAAASSPPALGGRDGGAGSLHPPPPPELRVPHPAGLPPIQSVEWYSQPPTDYYAATAFLDLVSFAYAVVFYQLVVASARSLADITDTDRRLPLDYLAALMLLFGLMVAERAAYMLGWLAAKMALHLGSMALVLSWCLSAYWQSVAAEGPGGAGPGFAAASDTGGVRGHLRVFVLLRCLSFCLGALQLRAGYPPLSAPGPAGGGRHVSFFYRRADNAHYLAFNIFYSIPFLFEIRTLLDWTATTTSLDFYSWLKVEDIRSSLFIATCRNKSYRNRRLGDRVPRYVKFLQGVLALVALLLVLWLPPLFFSSGAPTYQVPTLQDVRLNISLAKLSGGVDAGTIASQRFPLFSTGDRRLIFTWTTPHQLPQPSEPPTAPSEPPDQAPGLPRPVEPPLPKPGSTSNMNPHDGLDQRRRRTTAMRRAPSWPPPPAVPTSPSAGPAPPPAPSAGSVPSLPRALAGYAPDQAKAVCVAPESDRLWQISPPARQALVELLRPAPNSTSGYLGRQDMHGAEEGGGAPVVLEISWTLARSVPLSSERSGPACMAAAYVPLSEPSRLGLIEVLSGRSNEALLTALNTTDAASHGSPGLFPFFMRLKGDTCSVRLGLQGGAAVATPPQGSGSRPTMDRAHNMEPASGHSAASARRRGLLAGLSWLPWMGTGGSSGRHASSEAADTADRWGAAQVGCYASLDSSGGPGAEWWTFNCGVLLPLAPSAAGAAGSEQRGRKRLLKSVPRFDGEDGGSGDGTISASPELEDPCGDAPGGSRGLSGPPLVAVLEPVQSGLLGATLSRFGVTGLYFTFVFALGRFLRLSVSSLRLRIPTEDLPSTRRLVALCQDIYVARAEGELVLEEQLYRALINVYRSPDLLFELSKKHKQS